MSESLNAWADGLFTQEALEETKVREEEEGEETEGLIHIYARNGFNKLYLLIMLWTVRHRFPLGVIFTLNCYRH